jgi:sec-independent protein translocase protein TatC
MSDREEELEEGRMPLLDHLIELRKRLMYSILALFVAFFPCWYFSKNIYNFLAQPLADALNKAGGGHFIFTDVTEAFFTDLRVAFWAAFCLAFPIIASQIWLFVAPGLYKQERMAFLPYLVATPLLFIMGGALVYYIIFPVAYPFFMSFGSPGGDGTLAIDLEPKVSEYLTFVMHLILAFGVAFQLPVLLSLMARAGLVTALCDRRYVRLGGGAHAARHFQHDVAGDSSASPLRDINSLVQTGREAARETRSRGRSRCRKVGRMIYSGAPCST